MDLRQMDFVRFAIGPVIMIVNILTIILVCRFENLRTKTNAILTSLAITDSITGFTYTIHPFTAQFMQVQSACIFVYLFTFMLLSIALWKFSFAIPSFLDITRC